MAKQKGEKTVKEKKKELLSFSITKRPPKNTEFGKLISRYIDKSGSCYDAKFTKKIRDRFPHWFPDIITKNNKEKLLLLPLNSKKPQKQNNLTSYTSQNSNSYDEKFTKQLRNRFPHWFPDIVAKNNKEKLLSFSLTSKRPNGLLGNRVYQLIFVKLAHLMMKIFHKK
jgi:hypothetical protein